MSQDEFAAPPALTGSLRDAEFRKTFDEYHPRLVSYFRRCGFSPSDVDDLSQTTLLNVYRSWDQYRGEGELAAWVFAAARNAARDAWRKSARAEKETVEIVQPDETLADTAPAVLQTVEDRDALARAVRALRELPSSMRACLLLHVQKGLSYGDVARQLGLSESTVKVQIWNARRRLRQLVGRERPS